MSFINIIFVSIHIFINDKRSSNPIRTIRNKDAEHKHAIPCRLEYKLSKTKTSFKISGLLKSL